MYDSAVKMEGTQHYGYREFGEKYLLSFYT